MNEIATKPNDTIPNYQVDQFQGLIAKLFQCCQERMQYQSDRFKLPDAELRCLQLFANERYLTPKGIAHKMNVVKSRVTKIIDGMVRRKLIQRAGRLTRPQGQLTLTMSANTAVKSVLLHYLDALKSAA